MAGELSSEQVLLLNNLMYMTSTPPLKPITSGSCEGKTIGQILESIDTSALDQGKDYGSHMTGKDWENLITAVENDDQLMNMRVEATHVESKGGGQSALFVDPGNNEAVVVFRGTASEEWKDNFLGGAATDAPDGVSTRNQQDALEWYQSLDLDDYDTVTVSGHSKGGNKAKYITVLDPSVDRCLSFDGQGFSDEFIEEYEDQIAERQWKIQNHNVEGDYVNLLLNDIGDHSYYEAQDLGEGGMLENHCPNTFFKFHDDGSFELVQGERDPAMAELDEFLNSYLRSLSPEEKQKTLELIGTLVEGGFNGTSVQELIDIALKGDNMDLAAKLFAYLVKYDQENPEFIDTLQEFLEEMGMENVSEIIETVTAVTNWEYFDKLADVADWLAGKANELPDWLIQKVSDFLYDKFGIRLTVEQCRKLLKMVQTMNSEMKHVNVKKSGSDKKVKGGGSGSFKVSTAALEAAASELQRYSQDLASAAERVRAVCDAIDGGIVAVRPFLKKSTSNIQNQGQKLKNLETALRSIRQQYITAENNNISHGI